MNRFAGRRCLVTGASSGLGRAIALALAKDGARVLGTGRSEGRLAAWRDEAVAAGAAPGDLDTCAADLTVPDEREALVQQAVHRFGGALDLLVQCAGVGAYGRFLSHEPEVLERLFAINVFAVAALARACHPLLAKGDRPAMACLGSIVGRRALPGRTEYSASKFALAGFLEALRPEWSFDGIAVVLLNPGFTRTAFEDNVLVDTTFYKSKPRRQMSPERCAELCLRAIARRRNEVNLTLEGRVLLGVNRVAPRFVDWGFGRWTRKLYGRHLRPGAG
jgi:short-subunit dehydrogenase